MDHKIISKYRGNETSISPPIPAKQQQKINEETNSATDKKRGEHLLITWMEAAISPKAPTMQQQHKDEKSIEVTEIKKRKGLSVNKEDLSNVNYNENAHENGQGSSVITAEVETSSLMEQVQTHNPLVVVELPSSVQTDVSFFYFGCYRISK